MARKIESVVEKVMNVVYFLLDNSLASGFYIPTFRNTLLHLHNLKMELTECSETSAYNIQTPGNYPEESIQGSEHGESFEIKNKIDQARGLVVRASGY